MAVEEKMGSDESGGLGALGEQVLHIAAGLSDLALEQAENAARTMRSLLRRSDLRDLVEDGLGSLAARGDLAIKRTAPSREPHMEFLARRAADRERPQDG